MKKYVSIIADWLSEFAEYREASGHFCMSDRSKLLYFDRHCSRFSNADTLTQEMVDTWMLPRPTEKASSCTNRIGISRKFISWARMHELTEVTLPDLPKAHKTDFMPHSFTPSELKTFFHMCDSISPFHSTLKDKLYTIIVPTIFRFLLSTGVRTCEARLLKRNNVDLDTGVVDINHSKGPDGHRIVLSPSMLDIMRRYDTVVEKLLPNREFMFPNADGTSRSRQSLNSAFRKIWRCISEEKARAYDFRAQYAAMNINSWGNEGTEWHWKLAVLSKTMGHKHLQSTCHYYNITPHLYECIENVSSKGLEDVIPNIQNTTISILHDYENEK